MTSSSHSFKMCFRTNQYLYPAMRMTVSTLMWHLVRKRAMAMTAWPVWGRAMENPGNTTASLPEHVLAKKRQANPN
ncbi:uncharacterized protein LOC118104676 [Hippoglossus stenolepis]|uniref:uncharacterized protein LOC118104676 n=1 Tax=Hippoglossus stenolepis TaxID=195615 RepID=UPI001FAEDC02|nr:uncharacterized protein LOC118104676 [Hippoglossus stenolepis]